MPLIARRIRLGNKRKSSNGMYETVLLFRSDEQRPMPTNHMQHCKNEYVRRIRLFAPHILCLWLFLFSFCVCARWLFFFCIPLILYGMLLFIDSNFSFIHPWSLHRSLFYLHFFIAFILWPATNELSFIRTANFFFLTLVRMQCTDYLHCNSFFFIFFCHSFKISYIKFQLKSKG